MERPPYEYCGLPIYPAGTSFPSFFSRDSFLAGQLFSDSTMLKGALVFASDHQGLKPDSFTGEEPGKIPHEVNVLNGEGVTLAHRPGYSTKYNGADTTALYLLAHAKYQELTNDGYLLDSKFPNIVRGINYIISHLNDRNLFAEDPKHAGADQYALKVTYWCDSDLPNRQNGEPVYPIVYTLAHVQNSYGLEKSAELLNSTDLRNESTKMRDATNHLFDNQLGSFLVAEDGQGPISVISSDALHAFAYMRPEDISKAQAIRVIQASEKIETPIGYQVKDPILVKTMADLYHVLWVWPHDNAFINQGAQNIRQAAFLSDDKELLDFANHAIEVSKRVMAPLALSDAELFALDQEGKLQVAGSSSQLWTMASRAYFLRQYPTEESKAA